MRNIIRAAIASTAVLVLIGIAGCGHKPTAHGVKGGQTGWTSGVANPIPGIDEACVTFVELKCGPPEGVQFVIWSDTSNGAGHGEGGVGGASYEGHHSAIGNRRIDFRAKTIDGITGSVTIAGVEYDLAKGSLFLVSTHAVPPTVTQFAFDLSSLPEGANELKEFAKATPQIRDYFEKHNKEDAKSK
jgi:hypothetical protein